MCLCGGAHLFHQLIRQIIKIEFHTHSHRHCECPAIIFFLWRIFRSRFQFNCVANWYVRIHWYPQILITNILIGNIRIHLEWEKQSTSQIASIIRSLSLSLPLTAQRYAREYNRSNIHNCQNIEKIQPQKSNQIQKQQQSNTTKSHKNARYIVCETKTATGKLPGEIIQKRWSVMHERGIKITEKKCTDFGSYSILGTQFIINWLEISGENWMFVDLQQIVVWVWLARMV